MFAPATAAAGAAPASHAELITAGATVIAGLVTAGVAILAYVLRHRDDLRTQSRKDQLERVNLQLRNLYGPIFVSAHAGDAAWRAFRSQHRPPVDTPYFDPADPPSEEEARVYRIWIQEVFSPINARLESTVFRNGDLLLEDEVHPCLLQACAHISAYKPIIRRWQEGDFTVHEAFPVFPTEDLLSYLRASYQSLKLRQKELLGELDRSRPGRLARLWKQITDAAQDAGPAGEP
jgi:hypothetical protein